MADLVKKIKIKKQDGTFTDYIPIGAEAQNISTNDGDSVQLKLNKKPYYYNNVADMKADTKLKVGDMAVTLGYYEPNDGGAGEYKIVSTTSKYAETLNNNLKAELIIKDYVNFLSCGGKVDNINDKNFNSSLLLTLINLGCQIDFQDKTYYIDRIGTVTSNIDWKNGVLIYTSTSSREAISFYTRVNVFLNNVSISVPSTDNARVFMIYYIDLNDVKITNCYFSHISLLRNGRGISSDPLLDTPFKKIIFSHNKCEDLPLSFCVFSDTPFEYAEISNNEIHNFLYVCFHFGINNDYSDQDALKDSMKLVKVNNNIVRVDLGYGKQIPASTSSSYYDFILTESHTCIFENNYFEGIITDKDMTTGAGYFANKYLDFLNNTIKNCLNISTNLESPSFLLKTKGCKKINCLNNVFTVDKNIATILEVDENLLRSPLLQQTESNGILIYKNNYIDIVWGFGSWTPANSKWKELVFEGNEINIAKLGYGQLPNQDPYYVAHILNLPTADTASIANWSICNNNINVTEMPTNWMFVTGNQSMKSLVIKNNHIRGLNLNYTVYTNGVANSQLTEDSELTCYNNIYIDTYPSVIANDSGHCLYDCINFDYTYVNNDIMYTKREKKYILPLSSSSFNKYCSYSTTIIGPLATSGNTAPLLNIGNKRLNITIECTYKDVVYTGSLHIRGAIENNVQEIYYIPKNSVDDQEIKLEPTLWPDIKWETDINDIASILQLRLGGTNKVFTWGTGSGYTSGDIVKLKVNLEVL